MSKFGYQPKPILPPDYEEFLEYQRGLNKLFREYLHSPKVASLSQGEVKKPQLEETNKKSTNNNNGELRNGNRSVKSNVHKQRRRNTTSSRK